MRQPLRNLCGGCHCTEGQHALNRHGLGQNLPHDVHPCLLVGEPEPRQHFALRTTRQCCGLPTVIPEDRPEPGQIRGAEAESGILFEEFHRLLSLLNHPQHRPLPGRVALGSQRQARREGLPEEAEGLMLFQERVHPLSAHTRRTCLNGE